MDCALSNKKYKTLKQKPFYLLLYLSCVKLLQFPNKNSNIRMCREFIRQLKKMWTLRNFILVSGFVIICLYLHKSGNNSLPSPLRLQLESKPINYSTKYNNKEKEERPRKILIWNSYWKSEELWNKVFGEIKSGNCPVSNCIFTLKKEELDSCDAILFHIVDLSFNSILPSHRPHWQIWIGMTYEPPFILTNAGLDLSNLNGLFNRTMSFRRDSDIVSRHGKFERINDLQTSTNPSFGPNWVNSRDDPKRRNYASGKRRLVAWFASARNCKSQSGRENYVAQLQRHVPVDIYGSCGKFKCGRQKTMRRSYRVEHDECYFLVSVAYKFVLAFENSICEDYVTEKLYNNLKLNVIPIVFGGGNYSFYAPPHSVIDASEYTPAELGSYLLLLDSNDTLYNAYFNWKKDFYIESHDGVPDACELCSQLHYPAIYKEQTLTHFDQWMTRGCKDGWEPMNGRQWEHN